MQKEKQIDIDIAVEEMASAVRERTVACNKCEYYNEGSCLKPIDLGCNDNEDVLNLCDAIYEKGYRKASEVAREIIADIEKIIEVNKDGEAKFDIMELHKIEKKYTENKGE